MARCSNCKAPLSSGSRVCDYCGARTDIDLQGIHYHTTNEHTEPRTCPACKIPLKTIDLALPQRFLIDRCTTCEGLFFDPNELETLLESSIPHVHTINHVGLQAFTEEYQGDVQPITYRPCPVCSQIMHRINFGAKSGVVINRCTEHGIWLDGGKLRQLMEWTKLGGKLLDQKRKELQLEELKRQAEQEQRQSERYGTATRSYNLFDEEPSSGTTILTALSRLVRIVTKM